MMEFWSITKASRCYGKINNNIIMGLQYLIALFGYLTALGLQLVISSFNFCYHDSIVSWKIQLL